MATFDNWLTVTDPGLMTEALATQFRLSQQELQKASEALAPAFAIGMQKAMADPQAWSQLTKAFMAMIPTAFGAPQQQPNAGPALLDAFFRSDALVGAVARQASLFAGIAPDTMQKLMPGLAMLSMDRTLRTMMDTIMRSQPAGLSTGDFGGATAEMMRRSANAVEALSRPSDAPIGKQAPSSPFAGNPLTDVFTDAMKTGLSFFQRGASTTPPPEEAPKRPRERAGEKNTARTSAKSGAKAEDAPADKTAESTSFNPMLPFAMMMDAFAKGIAGSSQNVESPTPPPKADPTPPQASTGNDTNADTPASPRPASKTDALVGEMLRSSQKIQEDYAREMAALFERYQGELKVGI